MSNKIITFPLTAKKSPAFKGDWRNYKGDVNTALVGVAVPEGLIILDLDTYKGVTIDDIESVLGCRLNWDEAELQQTLNGGLHYAFRVGAGVDLKNGSDLLSCKGFDTRSAGKGYIATGEGYESLNFLSVKESFSSPEAFPWLPSEAVEALRNGSHAEGEIGLLESVSAQPLNLDAGDVALYMSKLTAQHAEHDWLTVMFGLWHQTEGSERGWALFDEFSKLCPEKYDQRGNRSRWESCGKNSGVNRITFASVIKLAGGNAVVEHDKFEKLKINVEACETKEALQVILNDVAMFRMDALNSTIINKTLVKQFKNVLGETISESQIKKILKSKTDKGGSEFYEDYIFLTQKGEYMNRENKTAMGPRSFDVQHSRDTPADSDGNPQSATYYANDKIQCVYTGMYAPPFGDVFEYGGVEYFNTFKPTELKRVKQGTTDIVERIKGHVAHLLADEREQELVINYLAHNVQFPGKKLQWSMILQGVQGDGKSFLAEMMKHVLGVTNCRTVTVESLDEKYTAWSEGNCMVFIEELKLDNYKKYETLNKLKPYIANPTISVRKMQTDVYEAINTTNYFSLTNFKDALPIDDNDRRYCVLFSRWQSANALLQWTANHQDYYSNLYDDMRKHTGEILDFLLSHKIPDSFLRLTRAPDTDAKRQMISIAKSDDYLIVEDAINEFKCWDINEHVINITKLQNCIANSFESDYSMFPKTSRLKNILQDMSYHFIGVYKTKGTSRKNQRVYCTDENRKACDFAEEDGEYIPF